ncbi:hypothetical protein ARMSODRAFT_1015693 [Armillaria solidipes]|uniref:Uncharacterized protein n=1 Tax=Armillaria solidipes TaxID=1076256 RepID=A0A2H3BPR0_9AGAR|nr:hypothetical protein ARMSODRAFT_1015693 [Armillaria solidipes]
MDDRFGRDFAYRRLQPSILLTDASIPHVIWGQDAVEYNFGALFMYYVSLDLQILLSPSMIQKAVELLAPSYCPMTVDEIDAEEAAPKNSVRLDYTIAFRDRPNDFTRLKSTQCNTLADPSHVLLIANTIFNYPLDDIVHVSLPLCPELPFPSVPAIVRLMPVHAAKWMDADYTPQSSSFLLACETLLECAIESSFAKEVDEVYASNDQLPARLKDMIVDLDEHQKCWVYECFHIGVEMGESSSDSDADMFSLLANVDSHRSRL